MMDADDDDMSDATGGSDWGTYLPTNAGPQHRDISDQAVWTLSSCKSGYGIHELLHESCDQYWQSDGPQPHTVTIEFPQKTDISFLVLFLDYKTDESYTPNKVVVYMGSSLMHLDDGLSVSFSEPVGWQVVDLRSQSTRRPARAFVLQLQVTSNHQNGRDTHIRHMRVIGPSAAERDNDNPSRPQFGPSRRVENIPPRQAPGQVPFLPSNLAARMRRDLTLR